LFHAVSFRKPGFANSLVQRIGLLVVFALAAFTFGAYQLIGRPTIERLAESQMQQAADQTEARVNLLLKTVEATLRSSQGWGMHGELDHTQLQRFNEFFFPIIANHGEITSVIFAHESGREILLLLSDDGRWINRISDPEQWGRQTYWITWSAKREIETVEVRDLDYDARTRPWFKGAMSLSNTQSIHWTDPYIFYTTREPGITASMRWQGADGTSYVIGHDVRLSDVAEFTTRLTLGERGKAVLLGIDGKLLAPPKDPRFQNKDAINQALLKMPQELGIPELNAAFAAWQDKGRPNNQISSYQIAGDGRWFDLFKQIGGNRKFWLAILAPEADFIPVSSRELFILAMIATACLALGLVVAMRLAYRFGQPLDLLASESERIGRLELEQPVTTEASWREITQLATALEGMRRHLQMAHQAQENANADLELKVASRTQALRQNQAILQSREAFFRAVFDNAAVGIVTFNAKLQRTLINRAFASFTGYSTDTLLREPDIRVMPPAEYDRIRQALTTISAGDRETLRSEFEFVNKAGETRWGDVQISAVRNDEGVLDSLLITVLDITDRREIEAELIRQFSFLQALLDTIPNPIFYKGSHTRFLGCNRAYEEFFGIDRGDFIGKRVLDLDYLPEAERITYQAEDEAVIANCSRISHEIQMLDSKGQLCDTLYSVNGFRTTDGEPGGLIGIIVDITPLKHAEREAERARAAAEAASAAKADFLANMSHEIRTPMNAIIGMTHLALQTELAPRQKNYLSKVDNAAKGLLGIINDILDLSKIEAGMMLFEQTPFSLDGVMRHVGDMCTLKAHEQGLELLFDISPEVPDGLVGDPLRLGQLLLNLVGNAIKFTRKGEVTVIIKLAEKRDDTVRIAFEVCDTGIGMSTEQQARLFTAFAQGDSSTTRQYGGTGLGLSICKRIIDQLGGSINVVSEPGVGSRFNFELAFGRAAGDQETPPRLIGLPHGLRTLIVDDNAGAREIFSHMLDTLGLESMTAADAGTALRLLAEAEQSGRPVGLVVIDWQMPEVDGIQLLREMSQQRGSAPEPAVIMTTSYDHDALRAALGEKTIGAILSKPATSSSLFDAIIVALNRDAKVQPEPVIPPEIMVRRFEGKRVLLVEDNEVNRELAEEMLGIVGFAVDTAENGEVAVQRVRDTDYDLVLMDCHMPVMDGYEATRQIRQELQREALPIIAMTANALASDRQRCLATGMNDHIPKPIDVSVLYQTLAHWLETGTRMSAPPSTISVPEISVDFDTKSALSRLGGNQKILDRLFVRFRENQGDVIARLNSARSSNDRDALILHTHTLRGLAGNVGAVRLATLANKLEDELKHGMSPDNSTVAVMIEALEKALQPVLAMAGTVALEDVTASPANSLPSPEKRTEALSHLQFLLDNDDATAGRLLAEISGWLRQLAEPALCEQLARQVGRYEFESALNTLQQIRNTLNT
jgi:two-component system, sensor histidine kinase and response regulator